MSADRGRFICQSQSLNLFIEKPTFNNLFKYALLLRKSGLKLDYITLEQDLRSHAQKFTIRPKKKG